MQPSSPDPAALADTDFASAREILLAPSSPDQLREGIAQLESASARGSAAATELRALLSAMGIAGPQSWDEAFDLLVLAAQQGSPTARRQLLILADAPAGGDSDDEWTAVRASISAQRLLASNARESLSSAPRIRVIRSFATEAECNWLIERARPRLERATVIKKSGDHGYAQARSNSGTAFQVVEMDVVFEMVRARMAAATHLPLPLFEPTQVLQYDVGQEFRPHHDFLDPANPAHRQQLVTGQRIATFLIYLNGDFTGGETDFPAARVRFRGNVGDAIFWANLGPNGEPDQATIHAGLPPESGEKWILSQWIRDRANTSRDTA